MAEQSLEGLSLHLGCLAVFPRHRRVRSPACDVFEARRAIGQLVGTFGDALNPPGLEPSEVDPVLRYIRAAHDLEVIMGVVQEDLVAEARARGLTWETIGSAMGSTKNAAHNQVRGRNVTSMWLIWTKMRGLRRRGLKPAARTQARSSGLSIVHASVGTPAEGLAR